MGRGLGWRLGHTTDLGRQCVGCGYTLVLLPFWQRFSIICSASTAPELLAKCEMARGDESLEN